MHTWWGKATARRVAPRVTQLLRVSAAALLFNSGQLGVMRRNLMFVEGSHVWLLVNDGDGFSSHEIKRPLVGSAADMTRHWNARQFKTRAGYERAKSRAMQPFKLWNAYQSRT